MFVAVDVVAALAAARSDGVTRSWWAAVGLDQVTAGARSPVALAMATYVEEGGEGLAAVAVPGVVSAWGLRR